MLRTTDGGRTWAASDTPVAGGDAAGLASVAFRDDLHGIVVGGDLSGPASKVDAVARTADGGRTWQLGGRLPFPGAAYGVAYVPESAALVVVGPGGAGLSDDDGRTWQLLDGRAWWGAAASGPDAVWLTGPDGRIAKLQL